MEECDKADIQQLVPFKVFSANLKGGQRHLKADDLNQFMLYGKQHDIGAFLFSEVWLSKKVKGPKELISLVKNQGFFPIFNQHNLHGARTKEGNSAHRSVTMILINLKMVVAIEEQESGSWGNFSSCVCTMLIQGMEKKVRLTAMYGDEAKNKPWCKQNAEFMEKHQGEIHLVGGDMNRATLHTDKNDPFTKACTKYIDAQDLFYTTPQPTREGNVLDYNFVSAELHKHIPMTEFEIKTAEELQLQLD